MDRLHKGGDLEVKPDTITVSIFLSLPATINRHTVVLDTYLNANSTTHILLFLSSTVSSMPYLTPGLGQLIGMLLIERSKLSTIWMLSTGRVTRESSRIRK
jgi:hypothetical protein